LILGQIKPQDSIPPGNFSSYHNMSIRSLKFPKYSHPDMLIMEKDVGDVQSGKQA